MSEREYLIAKASREYRPAQQNKFPDAHEDVYFRRGGKARAKRTARGWGYGTGAAAGGAAVAMTPSVVSSVRQYSKPGMERQTQAFQDEIHSWTKGPQTKYNRARGKLHRAGVPGFKNPRMWYPGKKLAQATPGVLRGAGAGSIGAMAGLTGGLMYATHRDIKSGDTKVVNRNSKRKAVGYGPSGYKYGGKKR
jgi:hypothetical protein